jgi:ADP-ribose pyrophosphatase YjhB (NUDIX family)
MATNRKFCRFNKGASVSLGVAGENPLGMSEVPDGGLCLSAFLVISDRQNPNTVLMGHLNPVAPWDHIGALDKKRVEVHSKGWMLPSYHLMLHESPDDAATRILKEQLELEKLGLTGPKVVSDVYRPKRFPDLPAHWDLEFIYKGNLDAKDLHKPFAWTDLRFLDIPKLRKEEIGRSHEDVLQQAGFSFLQS